LPAQTAEAQTSPKVHATPSSQGSVLALCSHSPAMQRSSVQTLLSDEHVVPSGRGFRAQAFVDSLHTPTLQASVAPSQLRGLPLHEPALHVSSIVHQMPSSQTLPLAAAASLLHVPVATSQESTVQGFLSSQSDADVQHPGIPTPAHTESPVQTSPPVHG
jgi:hypothetical protein